MCNIRAAAGHKHRRLRLRAVVDIYESVCVNLLGGGFHYLSPAVGIEPLTSGWMAGRDTVSPTGRLPLYIVAPASAMALKGRSGTVILQDLSIK